MQNQNKITVMQLLPSLESGGVERGTIDIAKTLKNENFNPIVLSAGGILVYDLKESKINHITVKSLKNKNPISIFFNIKKIRKILIENHVDILHVRSRSVMWSAYFACKNTNVKLVSTVHGAYSNKFLGIGNLYFKKIYNSIMLKSDSVIAVSNYIKNYIINNFKCNHDIINKISVIQRGVDLLYFNPDRVSKNRIIALSQKWNLPEDKKIILMPARFTAWKGHEFLIDALTLVKNDFFCVMVGSDHGHKKYRKKIENTIIEKNLAGKIRVVDNCRDMPAAYAISHFVVAPSIRPEAFGRIAIEAQASNKIIIATKIGGALETIIDTKSGFLVELGDFQSFANIIDQVLVMDKTQVDKMGEYGRVNVSNNFSNQNMCYSTLKIYQKVIENNK
jgi:glycosyltransferase involved in cell wall biosynthesis